MAAGKENLIPMNERTEDEQREIARKGGIESGKARRRKRTMKEAAQIVLNAPVSAEKAELLKKYGILYKPYVDNGKSCSNGSGREFESRRVRA